MHSCVKYINAYQNFNSIFYLYAFIDYIPYHFFLILRKIPLHYPYVYFLDYLQYSKKFNLTLLL
jgi:hypothetical protein